MANKREEGQEEIAHTVGIETQGSYLGNPVTVAIAMSRGSSNRPETISISWLTSVGIAPIRKEAGEVAKPAIFRSVLYTEKKNHFK